MRSYTPSVVCLTLCVLFFCIFNAVFYFLCYILHAPWFCSWSLCVCVAPVFVFVFVLFLFFLFLFLFLFLLLLLFLCSSVHVRFLLSTSTALLPSHCYHLCFTATPAEDVLVPPSDSEEEANVTPVGTRALSSDFLLSFFLVYFRSISRGIRANAPSRWRPPSRRTSRLTACSCAPRYRRLAPSCV